MNLYKVFAKGTRNKTAKYLDVFVAARSESDMREAFSKKCPLFDILLFSVVQQDLINDIEDDHDILLDEYTKLESAMTRRA